MPLGHLVFSLCMVRTFFKFSSPSLIVVDADHLSEHNSDLEEFDEGSDGMHSCILACLTLNF